MQTTVEMWDVYTVQRQATGRTHQRGLPLAAGDYHLVVLIWIHDAAGRYIITRRHPDKPWPGYWECTGGSVVAGEDSRNGALREVLEETGLSLDDAPGQLIDQFNDEESLFDVWLFFAQPDLASACLQEGEVTEICWATAQRVEEMLNTGEMVPGLRRSFEAAQQVRQ